MNSSNSSEFVKFNSEPSTDQSKESYLELPAFETVQTIDFGFLTDSIAVCNKPKCDNADFECVVKVVHATLCEAVKIIESDPRQLFVYKNPTISTAERQIYDIVDLSDYSATSDALGLWIKIAKFDYGNTLALIRDFIGLWQVSPETKCVVLTNTRRHVVAVKGSIYFVDAHFSRPTQRCPNPLAVAKVRFIITVSNLMPRFYPVMITYRFEGHRTLFYALGERAIADNTFQRFYIDSILHAKLSFYAEICECRHGTVAKPKKAKSTEHK